MMAVNDKYEIDPELEDKLIDFKASVYVHDNVTASVGKMTEAPPRETLMAVFELMALLRMALEQVAVCANDDEWDHIVDVFNERYDAWRSHRTSQLQRVPGDN